MKKNTTYEKIPHNDFPIRVRQFQNYSSNYIHWHEQIEILYYQDNNAFVTYNLEEYKASCGDIVFVNGNELHMATSPEKPSTYYCFQLRTDFFSNFISGKYVVFENVIQDKDCSLCLDKVIRCFSGSDLDREIRAKLYMYEFLDILSKKYIKSISPEDEYKKNFKIYDRFNEIVIYINAHYDEPLTVPSLADRFFMSTSYFASMFRQNSGLSVMKYVNNLRIKHAKAYLDRDSMSISQVASAVGFDDFNYFSRKFKQLTGYTPSEYKKLKEYERE